VLGAARCRVLSRAALVLALVPAVAHADDDEEPTAFLNIGAIGTVSGGHHDMGGVGAEITYTSFRGSEAIGGFVQAELGGRLSGDKSFDDRRIAIGGYGMKYDFFGVEAGVLYRTAPHVTGTIGGQLGVFATVGIFAIGVRAGIAPAGERYGSDIGIVIASHVPLQVRGRAIDVKGRGLVPCIFSCRK